MKPENKLTISVFLLLFSLLPWGKKQKRIGKVFSFPISISISLARLQWVFARYLCKELMVFLIPVILLFLTLGPFATYVTNYFLWPGWGDKLIIKGEEERGERSIWNKLLKVIPVVFNSSQLQLTWRIVCAEIEFYWLIFENIIILPMTSPPEWGYGVERGDNFYKKKSWTKPSNLLFCGRDMRDDQRGKKLEPEPL